MSVEKLRAELTDAIEDEGLINIGVSWAHGAEKLTEDERAAEVSKMLAISREWSAKSDEEKMRIQIKESYEYLGNVIDLCKTDLSKPYDLDEAKRRSAVFCGIEQAMMLLGNWIDQDDKRAMRAARPKTSAAPSVAVTVNDRQIGGAK